jgi:hypothetical protein
MPDFAPDPQAAIDAVAAGEPVLITARRVDDLETPVSAYLKLAAGGANTFLLESVEGGAYRGRYSAIGLDPDLIWRCVGDRAPKSRAPRRPAWRREAFEPVKAHRWTPCARCSRRPGWLCPPASRPCAPACSAIWAMTWCAMSSDLPNQRGAGSLGHAGRIDGPAPRDGGV